MIYEIYTPEMLFAEGKAKSVTFSLTDGEFCVLDGHAPAFAALDEGQIIIKNDEGTIYMMSGAGAAEIKSGTVKAFVSYCEKTDKKSLINYQIGKKYKKSDKKAAIKQND